MSSERTGSIAQEIIELLGLEPQWAKACKIRDADDRLAAQAKVESTALAQMWETPPAFVRGIELRMGRPFDVDICAEAATAKARKHFGPGSDFVEDALNEAWPLMSRLSLLWCNPDFRRKGKWVRQVLDRAYPTILNVPLSTDMEYAAVIHNSPVCHITMLTGRVSYLPPAGVEASTPNGPTVLVALNFKHAPLPPAIRVDELMETGAEDLERAA